MQKPVLTMSRTEAVARNVREAIVNGEMPPGMRLNLDELALRYGVSRMPVREALKQLESEGLVTFYPYRGVEVAHLSVAEVEELYAIRVLLERRAVERAAARIDASGLAKMKVLLEQMDEAIAADDGARWFELNEAFHRTLNEASGWPKMVEMIDKLRQNIERCVRTYIARAGYEGPQEQHRELYQACLDHDPERAARIITLHIENTATLVMQVLAEEAETHRQGDPEPA
ncbi:putative HTH-type transcriptional regulator YdfH [Hartmannibacter diazotrophicus]|uniref:Putative HTH-type transcriptional regulator YdfH n=1 Tax=Hartmannibacter diazotrophicus TaxID=1482074 RepID=A0A2C9D8P2_9HYPH|nr:GntR family transcriptional regulator [Hartmannibacter diazotrophicus]SON56694.1 putative HTH-type transcriptional regulator YdfH [Hartmannibacter diazotrophicus]